MRIMSVLRTRVYHPAGRAVALDVAQTLVCYPPRVPQTEMEASSVSNPFSTQRSLYQFGRASAKVPSPLRATYRGKQDRNQL